MDDFDVTINAEGRTYSYILENYHYSANLKVVKKDAETGETVAVAGALFKILDAEGKTVEQDIYYPSREKISEFETDASGTLMLPEALVYGDYTLVELRAPEGYTLADPIPFTVSKKDITTDAWGDEIVLVNCSDIPVKGTIQIEKTGNILTGYEKPSFIWEPGGLKDCVFTITAAEPIYSPDHKTDAEGKRHMLYEKDEVVAELTTDAEGKAISTRLPLGTYTITETSAPEGYVMDSKGTTVELSYQDQHTQVVYETAQAYNQNQEYRIELFKTGADTEKPLPGATFGFYAAQDIVNARGEIIVKKDTRLETLVTNEAGTAATLSGLPTNVYVSEKDAPMYYLEETKAPEGYANNNKRYDILGKAEETKALTIHTEKINNNPISVSILKKGEEDRPLSGALLQVREKDAGFFHALFGSRVIDTWTSTQEPHLLYHLESGKEYILEELEPAPGYTTANPITFTVEDTDIVQEVEMVDVPTEIEVLKTNEDGKPLAGAVLQIKAAETGEVLREFTTTEKPEVFKHLPIGDYLLSEKSAPTGYALAEDIPFPVTDTGEIQKVHMKDELVTGKVMVKKADADSQTPLAGAEFELRNEAGEVLETLLTNETGTAVSQTYPIGIYQEGAWKQLTYTLTETKAPEGYLLDEAPRTIVFPWNNGTDAVVELVLDVPNKATEPKLPQTGEFPIGIVLAGIGLTGIGTGCALLYRGKKNNRHKRNQP